MGITLLDSHLCMYIILFLVRIIDTIGRMNKMKSICNHGKCKLQQLANLKPSSKMHMLCLTQSEMNVQWVFFGTVKDTWEL